MPVLEGVYAAVLTPRRRGLEEIDLAAYWGMLDFLSSKKVGGLLLMSSTGEFVHFTSEERSRMVGLAIRRSRVPVAVNVSHAALDVAIALAQAAAGAGAAALFLMPPYFFQYTQDDVLAWYTRFLEEVGTRVPLLLYNIPSFTTAIEPATASRLLAMGYAGIQDASGNWSNFEETRRLTGELDKTWLMGADALCARARGAEAHGCVSATASALPELMLAVYRSGEPLQSRLEEFLRWTEEFPVPFIIREAAALRGLKVGPPPAPCDAAREQRVAEFRAWFKGWWPVVEKECASA